MRALSFCNAFLRFYNQYQISFCAPKRGFSRAYSNFPIFKYQANFQGSNDQ